jgi:hypothetical protein
MADENVGARSSMFTTGLSERPLRKFTGIEESPSMYSERDAEALRKFKKQGSLTHDERVAQASESRRLDRIKRNLKPWWADKSEYEPLNLDEPGVESPQSPFNQSVDMSVESPQSKFNQSVDMSVESPFVSPVVSPQQYPRDKGTFRKSKDKDKKMFETDKGPFKFVDPNLKYSFESNEGESFRPFGGKTKRVKRRKTKRRKSIRPHR